MSGLQILLLSAHPLWLDACRRVLESFRRVSKVTAVLVDDGIHGNLPKALASPPDVAVLSLDVPAPSKGLDLVPVMRAYGYNGPVMVLCSRYALPSVEELARRGIQCVVSSEGSLKGLEHSIYSLADNPTEPLSQQYARAVHSLNFCQAHEMFKEREKEILHLVADDLTDHEIAQRLNLSVRTINNHLRHIYAKLQVRGRAGAVAAAITRGIIDLPAA